MSEYNLLDDYGDDGFHIVEQRITEFAIVARGILFFLYVPTFIYGVAVGLEGRLDFLVWWVVAYIVGGVGLGIAEIAAYAMWLERKNVDSNVSSKKES